MALVEETNLKLQSDLKRCQKLKLQTDTKCKELERSLTESQKLRANLEKNVSKGFDKDKKEIEKLKVSKVVPLSFYP